MVKKLLTDGGGVGGHWLYTIIREEFIKGLGMFIHPKREKVFEIKIICRNSEFWRRRGRLRTEEKWRGRGGEKLSHAESQPTIAPSQGRWKDTSFVLKSKQI